MKKLYFILIGFLVFGGVEAQIINFPDANFKAMLLQSSAFINIAQDANYNYIAIDSNQDGEIQLSEALQVSRLSIHNYLVNSLIGISSFTNLKFLGCTDSQLTSLDVSNLTNLEGLDCSFNQINNLNISGLINLKSLNCRNNQLTSLNISSCVNLENFGCESNQLQNLDATGLNNLTRISCYFNLLTNLNVTGLTNLEILYCWGNQLSNINVSTLVNLVDFGCSENQLTNIDISNLINLRSFSCSNNLIPTINFSGLVNIEAIFCSNNLLPSINLSGLVNLKHLDCSDNQLSILDIGSFVNLQTLYCSNNQITVLDISSLSHLNDLKCDGNQIQTLVVNDTNYSFQYLKCDHNLLTNISLGVNYIQQINCSYNLLSTIDISTSHMNFLDCSHNLLSTLNASAYKVNVLDCSHNQLSTLFIKNGINEDLLQFSNNPNLQYICADEGQLAFIQSLISVFGYTNCHVNSYCSFTPGGTFYTIQGNNQYDADNNGCSPTDINSPNLQLFITDGVNTANIIPNTSGSYLYDVQEGIQTITPTLENPTYFNVSPTTATVTFPTATSPYTQDFCITANGTHNDLEVTLLPIGLARPGFDAHYQIVYKNKGTNTQSGIVNLMFNDAVLDHVSAIPTVDVQTLNNLTWNFSNLAPFETRVIDVVLNLNSPLEVPPLNSGDILNYTAIVNGLTDETTTDNSSTLNQTVVNAFDPNYKTCIEGETIAPSSVGKYVHYMIGFENDGTANAENIVVKDMIDTAKYDITTLVPIKGSAPFTTRIINTNKVEFIFQNINLPFATGSNQGYVAFKIKTKPTLVLGDTFSNTANIYFDYNAPIVTNTATTTIAALVNPEFMFSDYFTLSPIPTKGVLNINTKQDITITSISVYNTVGQVVLVTSNPSNTIDVSNLTTGSYFIKVITDKGTSSVKFIKE